MKTSMIFIVFSVLILSIFVLSQKNKQSKTTVSQAQVQPTQAATPTPTKVDIPLEVSRPLQGAVYRVSTIYISGKTVPKATVTVGNTAIKADVAGAFTTRVILKKGENRLKVVASDSLGNTKEKELLVTYNVLPTSTPVPTP